MIPNKPIVLRGKDAKVFEEYRKRPATEKEIKLAKKADEFYHMHCLKNESGLFRKTKI